MAVFLLWGAAWLASKLSAVLIPLAAGAILACLLDPLVVFLARWKVKRRLAVLMVFAVIGGILMAVRDPFLSLLGASKDTMPYAREYGTVLLLGYCGATWKLVIKR